MDIGPPFLPGGNDPAVLLAGNAPAGDLVPVNNLFVRSTDFFGRPNCGFTFLGNWFQGSPILPLRLSTLTFVTFGSGEDEAGLRDLTFVTLGSTWSLVAVPPLGTVEFHFIFGKSTLAEYRSAAACIFGLEAGRLPLTCCLTIARSPVCLTFLILAVSCLKDFLMWLFLFY